MNFKFFFLKKHATIKSYVQLILWAFITIIFVGCETDTVELNSNNSVADMEDGYYRELWDESILEDQSNARVGGQIIDEVAVDLIEPQHSGALETDVVLDGGYVLTGIGLRMKGNDIRTMHMERRYLNSNGTLGTRYFSKHGSESEKTIEVWYAVPDPYVIVGVGFRAADDDVTHMYVHYRKVVAGSNGNGPELTGSVVTKKVGGSHTLELELIPGNEPEFDINKTAITGAGFRANGGDLTWIRLYAGEIRD